MSEDKSPFEDMSKEDLIKALEYTMRDHNEFVMQTIDAVGFDKSEKIATATRNKMEGLEVKRPVLEVIKGGKV